MARKLQSVIILILSAIILFSLSACKNDETDYNFDEMKNSLGIPTKVVSYGQDVPGLSIVYGNETYNALKGTYSWTYNNGDGTFQSTNADSLHPLQAKEYMPEIPFFISTISSVDPLTAYLQFDSIPDSVSVRGWSTSEWDNTSAESKIISVKSYDGGANGSQFAVSLEEEPFVYEITAIWEATDGTGGSITYLFYTAENFRLYFE